MELRATRTFHAEPWLPSELEPLRAVAGNLFWTWNTDTAALFERLSPEVWRHTGHNPVKLLQDLSRDDLDRLAADESVLEHVRRASDALQHYLERPPQVTVEHTSATDVIAYFSFEFALTESFPQYSGGLGVLAGDHLKSASDLGLPLVGVGLLYREGYFLQALRADGWQTEDYQAIDPVHHPLTPILDDGGQQLTVTAPLEQREVQLALWQANVGQVRLLLLDSYVPENSPDDQRIASRLYGGDAETRIQQEILLGIGGVRALRALGLAPAVCHMNEGHSSLLALERIRGIMAEAGVAFDEARLPVAAATVFTTHTPVAAGIDLFAPELVQRYLAPYYQSMGLDDRTFIGLGRMDPADEGEPFSMALLGLRLSGFRNGVSRLHGHVSRGLWAGAWPSAPREDVPIASVTNGVHLPTWVSHENGELFDRTLGRGWRDDPMRDGVWGAIHDIPDDELWRVHSWQRQRLVARARDRQRESAARHGLALGGLDAALNPDALTIGFARRFAGYKRATLLFRDPDRLARIVNNAERPVQVLFAGKAHPMDEPAKHLIQEVVIQARRPEFQGRLAVLERYDVDMARSLVQGCDVWLNTPLRPLEASGTSGMKAVANGALHLSVLDGWWAEGYAPGLGWAIGRDSPDDDPEVQDAFDADSLYSLLEDEIVPLFYERDGEGIPRAWVGRMKSSIAAHAPRFSTHRMVGEYAERAYSTAARDWTSLRADRLAIARDLAKWLAGIRAGWPDLKVLDVVDDGQGRGPSGRPVEVRVQAHWGSVAPESLRVEAVSGPAGPDGLLRPVDSTRLELVDITGEGICTYGGTVSLEGSGRLGYAIRVTPEHAGLPKSLDTGLVLWA